MADLTTTCLPRGTRGDLGRRDLRILFRFRPASFIGMPSASCVLRLDVHPRVGDPKIGVSMIQLPLIARECSLLIENSRARADEYSVPTPIGIGPASLAGYASLRWPVSPQRPLSSTLIERRDVAVARKHTGSYLIDAAYSLGHVPLCVTTIEAPGSWRE